MMKPAQKAAMEWEAAAIEKCRNDPRIAELGLCYICMCAAPCLCVKDATIHEMRKYYEANRRNYYRSEPSATGSWGKKIDVLMDTLFKIATEPYKKTLMAEREKGQK